MSQDARTLYDHLLDAIRPLGPFEEEFKKTSVHLVRGTAFLGVHPRKSGLMITLKSSARIESPRIAKAEQTSRSRWHLDLKLSSATEIDAELLAWIQSAYELG